jgi:hypothetical protein
MKNSALVLGAIFVGFGSMGAGHAAALFVPGSTFQVQATNSPNSFDQTVTLAPGTYSLDSGAVSYTISFVPAGGTDLWLVFNYALTTPGVALSGDDYWELLQTGLDAAVPLNFIRGYSEILINGVSQAWSYSPFGGYSPVSSPVPGLSGTGLGSGLFVDKIPAGPIGGLGAFLDPFSGYVNSAGINAAAVNGWTEALEFQAQTPIPEASTWAMMLLGFAGLGFMSCRQAGKARAAAA